MTPQRASQIVTPLEGFGLAARHRDRGGRLALTDRGLALLARRDRTSVVLARRRGASPRRTPTPPSGGATCPAAGAASFSGTSSTPPPSTGSWPRSPPRPPSWGWEVVQLDPPRRPPATSGTTTGRAPSTSTPSACSEGTRLPGPSFLEWERRAVPALTHVGASRSISALLLISQGHRRPRARPAVLVVFDDDIAATHFLRVARELMREAAALPLWVSHREAVDALGPLGRAWRTSADPASAPGPCPLNEGRRGSGLFSLSGKDGKP